MICGIGHLQDADFQLEDLLKQVIRKHGDCLMDTLYHGLRIRGRRRGLLAQEMELTGKGELGFCMT